MFVLELMKNDVSTLCDSLHYDAGEPRFGSSIPITGVRTCSGPDPTLLLKTAKLTLNEIIQKK